MVWPCYGQATSGMARIVSFYTQTIQQYSLYDFACIQYIMTWHNLVKISNTGFNPELPNTLHQKQQVATLVFDTIL